MELFQKPEYPLLVFTDLDGSLLDHDNYGFDAALPALQQLKQHKIPVIFVSSKTLVEIETLGQDLQINHPIIAENGALVSIPANYFSPDDGQTDAQAQQLVHLGETYESIVATLTQIRATQQWRFTGFNDMSVQQIADVTKLDLTSAANAKNRQGSEPLIWQDSDEALTHFEKLLNEFQLSLTRGGRFFHVMGSHSKGDAIKFVLESYNTHDFIPITTIGLGDSENDLSMLQVVDQAVVIRRSDQTHMHAEHVKNVYYTQKIGPAGWHEFIDAFLMNYSSESLSVVKKGNAHG